MFWLNLFLLFFEGRIYFLLSDLLNAIQNGNSTSTSLPVIYLCPSPLLGSGVLGSRCAGPLISAAAAASASPLPSSRA
jgi:hypothetical protein